MFTGIVEEIGVVEALKTDDNGGCLQLHCQHAGDGMKSGDSLAVQGICLTITQLYPSAVGGKRLQFDLGSETVRRTNLSELRTGEGVHLERPLSLQSRLHGHLVQGHVDGVGVLKEYRNEGGSLLLNVIAPASLFDYMISQGSIAVDGVSLTIVSLQENPNNTPNFSFMLTPHTQRMTTLGKRSLGSKLNLEIDMLAKYVHRFLYHLPPDTFIC